MEQVIRTIESATGLPVKPFGTNTIEDCICYKIVPMTDNGAVATNRLELRIITSSLEDCLTAKSAILSSLVTVGDEKKLAHIQDCHLNGGGSLYDANTKTTHVILYLIITTKSEVISNGKH